MRLRKSHPPLLEQDKDLIIKKGKTGMPVHEIADELYVCAKTIYKVCEKNEDESM